MDDRLINRDKLAALFQVGDKRIKDLIQLLDDPDQEISLRAQIVIRYLGTEIGMKGLLEWYGKRKQFSVAGPIPLPLREWDYDVIYANYVGKPVRGWYGAEPYIYALALDYSPRARAVLDEVVKSAKGGDESLVAVQAIKRIQASQPKQTLKGQKDLAKLVLRNAFFVSPEDRKHTSARLLNLSDSGDKALVEVYINRGALAEEWYHVVIQRCEQDWKFLSISQVGVS
jgi:hypothetical protein